mmetsp:Transcript_14254/g.31219  ORF Transcript_14254/g.31219 Transcript_14254/m.31219 type:complete len:104 (-) Transcript_14254:372-683(-)
MRLSIREIRPSMLVSCASFQVSCPECQGGFESFRRLVPELIAEAEIVGNPRGQASHSDAPEDERGAERPIIPITGRHWPNLVLQQRSGIRRKELSKIGINDPS